ncbi:MAG: isocitrate/isopropylmalate dehydrogenase family protein [Nitrososphaerales archaeon]
MPRSYRISCIEGDGIGPEIFASARSVLETLSSCCKISFDFVSTPAGDKALKDFGEALPKTSFNAIRESDLCLKAPVGETAKDTIVFLRQELDLYANIRPAKNYSFIDSKFSDVDMMIVRENTEDLYVGREFVENDGKKATAFKIVTEKASKRIAKVAFEMALQREASRSAKERSTRETNVICVHKSNVLPITDGLFLKSCTEVSKEYPNVKYSQMYVDTAAMNLIRNPESFDVLVTSNMYGDILSDEASQVVGGLGIASSANLSDDFALFEPVHGCAPDIAGKGIANPLSMMFTVKTMLEWLGSKKQDANCVEAAKLLESAVSAVTSSNIKTPDIGGKARTDAVTRAISEEIRRQKSSTDQDTGMIRENVLLKW